MINITLRISPLRMAQHPEKAETVLGSGCPVEKDNPTVKGDPLTPLSKVVGPDWNLRLYHSDFLILQRQMQLFHGRQGG